MKWCFALRHIAIFIKPCFAKEPFKPLACWVTNKLVEVWLCICASLHKRQPEMTSSYFFQHFWYLFVLHDVSTGTVRTKIVIWTHFYDDTVSSCILNLSCNNAPVLFTPQWDSCSFNLTKPICDTLPRVLFVSAW